MGLAAFARPQYSSTPPLTLISPCVNNIHLPCNWLFAEHGRYPALSHLHRTTAIICDQVSLCAEVSHYVQLFLSQCTFVSNWPQSLCQKNLAADFVSHFLPGNRANGSDDQHKPNSELDRRAPIQSDGIRLRIVKGRSSAIPETERAIAKTKTSSLCAQGSTTLFSPKRAA